MTGNPEHIREGLPFSSPTPWPSGPPRHRQQHLPVSFKKLKKPKNLKNQKIVKKVTSYRKKCEKIKKSVVKSGRKLKNKKVTQRSRTQYKKRNKNHQSISINPNLTHRHIYNLKNASIQYKSYSKTQNSIKNQKIPTKRNPPLKNRIKTLHLVTFYMIICLVLETYSVTQELGNLITRTYLKNDKTGIDIQTLKGSHKSTRTGVCILGKGTNRVSDETLNRFTKSNEKVVNVVKRLKKSDSVFNWLNNSDKQGVMIRGPIEYCPRIEISGTYSQAVVNYIKYANSVQNTSYVSVFNCLSNTDKQGNTISSNQYKCIPVSEIGFTHFQAVIFHSKQVIIVPHVGHISISKVTQSQITWHRSLRCASLLSGHSLLSEHCHFGLGRFDHGQKNKLHDHKMTNKLRERPMSSSSTPAVRTVPSLTWSSSSWTAAWVRGWGEEVMDDFQTPGDTRSLVPGPPEAQVPDLDVGDLVGRVGGLEGEQVRGGPKVGPSLGSPEVKGTESGAQATGRSESDRRMESGAVTVMTESEAENELKEVSKTRLKQLDLFLNTQSFRKDYKNYKNYKTRSQNESGYPNLEPDNRPGIPIILTGRGKEKGKNKVPR